MTDSPHPLHFIKDYSDSGINFPSPDQYLPSNRIPQTWELICINWRGSATLARIL